MELLLVLETVFLHTSILSPMELFRKELQETTEMFGNFGAIHLNGLTG